MKKVRIKKAISIKSASNKMRESEFWKRIALQQQVLIHAKNRT